MADELAVVIKTKLEIDEQQLHADIGQLEKNGIKIPVEADSKSFNDSIGALQKNPPQINVQINADQIVETLRSKLQSAKFNINVNTNAIAQDISRATEAATKRAAKKNGQSSGTIALGVNVDEIAGAQKYVDRLVAKAKEFESSFTDATAKITSTDIAYKPLEKMWQATVKYEDSIGRTTAMMFSMNEGMEEINVSQLKLTENAKRQRQEIEKTLDFISKHESAYSDLFSKAFDQKNKLTDDEGLLDDFGYTAMSSLLDYQDKINEVKERGAAITEEQKRELETLRKNAGRTIKEQQDAKWGATDFAAKDITKEIEIEYAKLQSFIQKYSKMDGFDVPSFNDLQSLSSQINPSGSDSLIRSIDDLNKWRAEVKLAKAEFDNFTQSFGGRGVNLSLNIDDQISSIDHILSNERIASGNTDGVNSLRKELQSIRTEYDILKKSLDSETLFPHDLESKVQTFDDLDQRLTSASKSAKLFNDSLSSNASLAKADAQIEKLKNDLNTLEVNWSKALEIPELKADINSLHAALDSADAISLPNVQKQFTELRAKIKAAGADCKSFGSQLVDAFNQIKSYFSVAEIFQYVRQGVSEMVDAVKEVDSAMIELRKVTDLSESGYDQFTKDAAGRAKVIGTDLVDYIAGTADFARLGYNTVDAQTLSESTNILYKVGDGLTNIEQASDAVIASMAAYGLKVSDVTSIVDKFNEVSNKTSIDTAGLTEAVTRSASALAVSGLDLDKSLALIVAGNEVTRDAAATGTALKSLSLRIRGAESDLKDMGEETDDYVKSTSKLRSELKALTGVDIMIDDSQFKDLYDIMDEISNVYDSLADIDKANVTEILFGKQRASVGASILLNFDKAEEALYAAQNSTGSAMTEHERWAQSIEAAEQRAIAAFQEFSITVVNSELIKGVYDTGAGILGFLTNIIEKLGAIPALAATVAGALSFKNIGISKMNMPYPTRRSAVA